MDSRPKIPRIILASRSPARRALMKELGVPFECHSTEIFEDMEARRDPVELAMHLASQKARAAAIKFPDSIIIGVDTFIVIGLEKIGKPATVKEAKKIISSMNDKSIDVISGMAVMKTDSRGLKIKEFITNAVTTLKIKKMTAAEIDFLANHEEALQISGAFSIEGEGGKMVEKIDGDFNNVIGLPLFQLREILPKLGVKLA
jgi:septum formation protein